MPFPTHPPQQMPCPHWIHFPVRPKDTDFSKPIRYPVYCDACAKTKGQAK